MKVRQGTTASVTGAVTVTTAGVRLDKYPFEDNVTLQLDVQSGFTGTITLQGRSHPEMEWFSIGAAIDPAVSGLDVITTRSFAAEYRLSITKTNAGTHSVAWWIGQ